MNLEEIEKLGAFYLGRKPDGGAFLVDERAFTTHAVCIGMTGSGKTGLCTALIEEAAIDGIPSIVVDPKGDLAALALAFPDLATSSFVPYLDAMNARRAGKTVDELAVDVAAQFEKGLVDTLQTKERIAKYRNAVDVRVYTPGSSAGHALSIVGSLKAPPQAVVDDADSLRHRLTSTTAGLLTLVEVDAGLHDNEHVLLAKILEHHAYAGTDLTLESLIGEITKPPFAKLGVLAVDDVMSEKDRRALALKFNNLLAAPGFQTWLEGDALDIPRLLFADSGKPRVSVISTAHLSDRERTFVVTLLLTELVAWMRQQPGTSSLRCLVFLDEVTGLLPPVANPPTKPLLLTLLKQARAFGVGLVLATQNPVDLDYKALANCGTWMLGRLQTDRDRARVLDGLEGVAGFDRDTFDKILAGLPKRGFLVHSGADAPVVVQSRQTLTFLPGPLSTAQIRGLKGGVAVTSSTPSSTATNGVAGTASLATDANQGPATSRAGSSTRENEDATGAGTSSLGTDAVQGPATARATVSTTGAGTTPLDTEPKKEPATALVARPGLGDVVFRPVQFVDVELHFVDKRAGVDLAERRRTATARGGAASSVPLTAAVRALPGDAKVDGTLPSSDVDAGQHSVTLMRSRTLKLVSTPGEDTRAFSARVRLAAQEKTDADRDVIKSKYQKKLDAMHGKLERLERDKSESEQHASKEKLEAALSAGTTILGAIFGRSTFSSLNLHRAESAARSVSHVRASSEKAKKLEGEMTDLQFELREIEELMQADIAALPNVDIALEEIVVTAKEVRVIHAGWIWAPYNGDAPAW